MDSSCEKENITGYIGPITDTVLNSIIKELRKKHNKEKIMKNIIDPLVHDITNRYYPHFISVTVVLIVIVILLFAILLLTVFQKQIDKY